MEPQATFSSCFGAAFMTLHPTRYADLFLQKLQKHNVNCYLVNTGWTGGYVHVLRVCVACPLPHLSVMHCLFMCPPSFGPFPHSASQPFCSVACTHARVMHCLLMCPLPSPTLPPSVSLQRLRHRQAHRPALHPRHHPPHSGWQRAVRPIGGAPSVQAAVPHVRGWCQLQDPQPPYHLGVHRGVRDRPRTMNHTEPRRGVCLSARPPPPLFCWTPHTYSCRHPAFASTSPLRLCACVCRYDKAANHLANLFVKNFQEFKKGAKVDYSVYGPVPAK